MKMNKTINYEDLIHRNKQIDELKGKGFIIIPKKRFKVVGWCLIGLSVLSIPIPFTSIPLLLIGFALLGLSYAVVLEKLRRKFKLMLYKYRSRK